MKLFNIHSKNVGLPPGTLVPDTTAQAEPTRISTITYNQDSYTEKNATLEECKTHARQKNDILWVNVDGLGDIEVFKTIGELFQIHDLVLEDVLHTGQRPKCEEHDDYIFCVLKMIKWSPEAGDIDVEQVSLLLGNGFVLSFQERQGDVFDNVRDRIRKGKGRVRKMGADYLLYALMDAVVDNYFSVIEQLGSEIETLETEILEDPQPDTSARIHRLKQRTILLRRSIWPLREVVSSLHRTEMELIEEKTTMFYRDVYDHTIQVAETLETFRDMVSSLLDVYLTSVSNRMNEVMKTLTIIATLFIPLSFIVGLYGMNFKYMPELELSWGYPAIWVVIVSVVAGFLAYFKRKKWI